MRKSPGRHRVKGHMRKGKWRASFWRGHGFVKGRPKGQKTILQYKTPIKSVTKYEDCPYKNECKKWYLCYHGVLPEEDCPRKILKNPDLQKQLKIGTKIEMEHTKDPDEAKKIALDHLKEFPDYYTRLVKMEAQAKKEWKDVIWSGR